MVEVMDIVKVEVAEVMKGVEVVEEEEIEVGYGKGLKGSRQRRKKKKGVRRVKQKWVSRG